MTNKKTTSLQLVPVAVIERRIFLISGKKVMLDRHLADLYEVATIALRQAVKRNLSRFPDDCVFQLPVEEAETLVSQNVIPSRRSFGGGFLPYAFTEQGVAMLSSVSPQRSRDRGEHRHHAHVRSPQEDSRLTQRAGGAAARDGEEV